MGRRASGASIGNRAFDCNRLVLEKNEGQTEGGEALPLKSVSCSLEHETGSECLLAGGHYDVRPTGRDAASRAQTVVIVNGTQYGLDALETVLEPGSYDVVIADSTSDAYSLIKRVKPGLVLIGLPLDDLETYQVLSMLKLDAETSRIRIVLCTDESHMPETSAARSAPACGMCWPN